MIRDQIRARTDAALLWSRGKDPPMSLSQRPDDWAYAALLWSSAWDGNFTFLHLPKTGGSLVEELDVGGSGKAQGRRGRDGR